MEITQKIKEIEEEVKILKNEIKQVLLDIKEHILTRYANPFANPDLEEVSSREFTPQYQQAMTEGGEAEKNEERDEGGYLSSEKMEEVKKSGKKIDLSLVLMLARWAEEGIRRIGKRKVEGILEIYELAGHLSPDLKEILLKLIHLSDTEEPQDKVTIKDLLAVLLQLDALVGKNQRVDLKLLSLLLGGEELWTRL